MPSPKRHLLSWVQYNAWGHEQILNAIRSAAVASHIGDDLGLPVRSIHATLNHILLAEQLWFSRLAPSTPMPGWVAARSFALWGPPSNAGQWDNLSWLPTLEVTSAELAASAARWRVLVEGMSDDALDAKFSYLDTYGQPHTRNVGRMISHVVNHSTHHRGQISAAITRLGGKPVLLDFPYSPAANEEGDS